MLVSHLQLVLDDFGFVQITDIAQENLFGKQLQRDGNFIVLDAHGSLSGTWGDSPVIGTWKMKSGLWC